MTPPPASLRQLQYLVAVAEERSFRKAAERCHVAQPSLSAQIAALESALGVRLFERDKGVLLTREGDELLMRARRILLETDDLLDAASRLSDPLAGTLRVGVIPTVSPYLLPETAAPLRSALPRMRFVWVEDKTHVLIAMLESGALDGALLALEADIGDVEAEPLGKDPFVLAAPPSHPLAQGTRPLRLRDLADEDVLFLDDGHCFRDQALAFCSRSGSRELDVRATSLPTLLQMVAAGAGITLLPSLAVPVENRRGQLVIRAFEAPEPGRTLALVWRRGSPVKASMTAIAECLRGTCGLAEAQGRRRRARAAPAP